MTLPSSSIIEMLNRPVQSLRLSAARSEGNRTVGLATSACGAYTLLLHEVGMSSAAQPHAAAGQAACCWGTGGRTGRTTAPGQGQRQKPGKAQAGEGQNGPPNSPSSMYHGSRSEK